MSQLYQKVYLLKKKKKKVYDIYISCTFFFNRQHLPHASKQVNI